MNIFKKIGIWLSNARITIVCIRTLNVFAGGNEQAQRLPQGNQTPRSNPALPRQRQRMQISLGGFAERRPPEGSDATNNGWNQTLSELEKKRKRR